MDDFELRLQALRMAREMARMHEAIEETLFRANEFYMFLIGHKHKSEPRNG